jgi:serine/threonine protein kinase
MREPTSRLTRIDDSTGEFEHEAIDEAPLVGQIGRFTVLRKLGEGGMGVVYAAHDQELDRHVAIKLLRTDASDVGPARARLLREARAMAKLSHPNVITIYDVGTIDTRVFIAMELVEGTTLRRWLKARPRTWRGVVERFSEAGRGLAAAHAAGLIHRDFKPDNVLVGDDGRVRVLDFGLARRVDLEEDEPPRPVVDSESSEDRLTVTGAIMGTPAYMAPEQWRGLVVDHRSDQFAFAVALWEGLFGERPFKGGGVHAIATHVLAGERVKPPEDRPVPTWLLRVLERALSTDPADRFGSIDELLFVLSRLNREPGERPLPSPESSIALDTSIHRCSRGATSCATIRSAAPWSLAIVCPRASWPCVGSCTRRHRRSPRITIAWRDISARSSACAIPISPPCSTAARAMAARGW